MAADSLGVKCSVGLAEDVALYWLGAGPVNAHAGLTLAAIVALSLRRQLPHSFPAVISSLF